MTKWADGKLLRIQINWRLNVFIDLLVLKNTNKKTLISSESVYLSSKESIKPFSFLTTVHFN